MYKCRFAVVALLAAGLHLFTSSITDLFETDLENAPGIQWECGLLVACTAATWAFKYNCLATLAFRAPRTSKGDAIFRGSWLMLTNALRSLPSAHALPHADNITRRQQEQITTTNATTKNWRIPTENWVCLLLTRLRMSAIIVWRAATQCTGTKSHARCAHSIFGRYIHRYRRKTSAS